MKTAKYWAEEIRKGLGNCLRADPVLVSEKTLIEEMVEEIQKDAQPNDKILTISGEDAVIDRPNSS